MKLIDVWLLYGLTLPFLGFILSCLEEIYHEPTPTHTTSKVKPIGMLVGDQMKNNKQAEVQKLGRVVLPVMILPTQTQLYRIVHFPDLDIGSSACRDPVR